MRTMRLLLRLLLGGLCACVSVTHAQVGEARSDPTAELAANHTAPAIEQHGSWVSLPAEADLSPGLDPNLDLAPTEAHPAGGGVLWYQLEVAVSERTQVVIDFTSSSVVDSFTHYILDSRGQPFARIDGGLGRPGDYDYFLRHGRAVELPPGDYRVITRLESPFYLALPTPRIYRESSFRQDIVYGQALTLVGMGIFLGLGFYYLMMGLWRGASTDLLYALFIVGNLLYNGAAQLVFSHLFHLDAFHLISTPILFSNVIYIGFVMRLLRITPHGYPKLFKLGIAVLTVLIGFWPVALIWPNWSLELCRIGVGVFALYGLFVGGVLTFRGHKVARLYLLANAAFAVPALISISLKSLPDSLWLIEHLGMIAVLVEILLLAQVLSYQIAQVYRERSKNRVVADQGALLSNLTAQAPGVVYQLHMNPDGDLHVPFVSRRIKELFEIAADEAQLDIQRVFARIHPEDYPAVMTSIAQSARRLSTWQREFRVVLPERGLRWLEAMATPERLENGGTLWYGFVSEVTERKQVEEQIRHMAQHDSLTNLPNRVLFNDRLEHALQTARREDKALAVMFVDLDNFKTINDDYGHNLGDLLLQQLATILTINLRAADTVARLGGDEFVVLLESVTSGEEAVKVAEKICQASDQPIEIDGHSMRISTSIGLALFPDHGRDAITLLRHADQAMYWAKSNGRNQVKLYAAETPEVEAEST